MCSQSVVYGSFTLFMIWRSFSIHMTKYYQSLTQLRTTRISMQLMGQGLLPTSTTCPTRFWWLVLYLCISLINAIVSISKPSFWHISESLNVIKMRKINMKFKQHMLSLTWALNCSMSFCRVSPNSQRMRTFWAIALRDLTCLNWLARNTLMTLIFLGPELKLLFPLLHRFINRWLTKQNKGRNQQSLVVFLRGIHQSRENHQSRGNHQGRLRLKITRKRQSWLKITTRM